MSIPRNLSIHADTLNSDGNFTSITDTGNLTFTGTGNRITGDFSNATVASRVAFQTSTVNSNTLLTVIPNGTATQAQITVFGASDPANTSTGLLINIATEVSLRSAPSPTAVKYEPVVLAYKGGLAL